ncbi:hypothetical protein [Minwuia thermotolerans]|nr:hypothetical protein [Minwuia thermotolerans]
MMFGCRTAMALSLLALAIPQGSAVAQRLAGEMKAEVVREAALPERLHVRLDRQVDGAETVRAIFHDVLVRLGYRIDAASDYELLVRWDGRLEGGGFKSRFQPEAKGGSSSDTSLGLSILLTRPSAGEGEETYTVGCLLSDAEGPVWKAKIVAVSADRDRERIVRILAERLIERMGKAVKTTAFDTTKPDQGRPGLMESEE